MSSSSILAPRPPGVQTSRSITALRRDNTVGSNIGNAWTRAGITRATEPNTTSMCALRVVPVPFRVVAAGPDPCVEAPPPARHAAPGYGIVLTRGRHVLKHDAMEKTVRLKTGNGQMIFYWAGVASKRNLCTRAGRPSGQNGRARRKRGILGDGLAYARGREGCEA